MNTNRKILARIVTALLAIVTSVTLGCGGDAISAPTPAPSPQGCQYEDLSTWRGGEGAWPRGMRFYLQYGEGCEQRAVSVSVAARNPEDPLRLSKELRLPRDAFVRLIATAELLDGFGALSIEVRDLEAPWSVRARANDIGIAEIKTWLPSGHGEVVLQAQALDPESLMIAMFSNVVVETR